MNTALKLPHKLPYLERFVFSAILLAFPVLSLLLRGATSVLFFVLGAICLVYLLKDKSLFFPEKKDDDTMAFCFAMGSSTLAIVLNQIYHGNFNFAPYDTALRFLLCIPVYIVLRQLPIKALTIMEYGFPIGAIATLVAVHITGFVHVGQAGERLSTYFLNAIHLGDLALMLGLLSLLSLHLKKTDHGLLIVLKLLGLLAGLYLSIKTGTRGGWLAIPFIFLWWSSFHLRQASWLKIGLAIGVALLLALLAYYFVNIIHERIDAIYSDTLAMSQHNQDTSIGIRMQLWNAAIILFKENFLFGVSGGFAHYMDALQNAHVLTPEAAFFGKGEVHNQLLSGAVNFGIFGLASLLAIFIVPLLMFVRALKRGSYIQKQAALMGIGLVMAFIIFGMTVEIFILKMTVTFYSLTVTVFLALAGNKNFVVVDEEKSTIHPPKDPLKYSPKYPTKAA